MAEVIHRYVRRGEPIPEPTKAQREREESDARFAEARARKETALATLREAELLRKRGELIARKSVIQQFTYVTIALRQRLLAMPAQLCRKLEGKSAHEIKLIVDGAVRLALEELANWPGLNSEEWPQQLAQVAREATAADWAPGTKKPKAAKKVEPGEKPVKTSR
jgi:hypothetical protein